MAGNTISYTTQFPTNIKSVAFSKNVIVRPPSKFLLNAPKPVDVAVIAFISMKLNLNIEQIPSTRRWSKGVLLSIETDIALDEMTSLAYCSAAFSLTRVKFAVCSGFRQTIKPSTVVAM